MGLPSCDGTADFPPPGLWVSGTPSLGNGSVNTTLNTLPRSRVVGSPGVDPAPNSTSFETGFAGAPAPDNNYNNTPQHILSVLPRHGHCVVTSPATFQTVVRCPSGTRHHSGGTSSLSSRWTGWNSRRSSEVDRTMGLWVSGTPSPGQRPARRARRGEAWAACRNWNHGTYFRVKPQSGTDSAASARKGRHVISVRRHLSKNPPGLPKKSSETPSKRQRGPEDPRCAKGRLAQGPFFARSERCRGATGFCQVVAATFGPDRCGCDVPIGELDAKLLRQLPVYGPDRCGCDVPSGVQLGTTSRDVCVGLRRGTLRGVVCVTGNPSPVANFAFGL